MTLLRFGSIVTLMGILLSSVAINGAAAAEPDNRPNIVFLLIDDQRNDTLGCAGHPILQTPVIDSLAAEGVRFSNAFVTSSICAASRASIFTGLTERTHGYTFRKPPLNVAHMAQSYPRLLREAGYRTGFVGKFGVKTKNKDEPDLMFDSFVPLDRRPYFKEQADGSMRHETELAGDHAIAFFEDHPHGTPFCLSISFNSVHAEDKDKEDPYPWPKAVDGLYDDITIPPPRLSDPQIFENLPDFLKHSLNRERFFWRWDTPEKYQKHMKAYFRMISGVDHVIGRIREGLAANGLAENTIIIYLGDNGYYMGDRGLAGKWSHYEQSLRVPFIIYDPRSPASQRGVVNDNMALNIDAPATMLDFAGVEIPDHYQGASLTPLLNNSAGETWRSDFFCEHQHTKKELPKWEGVRGERYMYANYFTQKPAYEFLHDLEKDPDQLINYASDPAYQEILAQMRATCEAYKNRYPKSTNTKKKKKKKQKKQE